MACGTVVLSSDNSSLPEVYGEGALVFENNNSKDLKDKMKLIINDEDLREDLIAKSFENIKRFSWENTAREINKLF